jgi:hypothetical protein
VNFFGLLVQSPLPMIETIELSEIIMIKRPPQLSNIYYSVFNNQNVYSSYKQKKNKEGHLIFEFENCKIMGDFQIILFQKTKNAIIEILRYTYNTSKILK